MSSCNFVFSSGCNTGHANVIQTEYRLTHLSSKIDLLPIKQPGIDQLHRLIEAVKRAVLAPRAAEASADSFRDTLIVGGAIAVGWNALRHWSAPASKSTYTLCVTQATAS